MTYDLLFAGILQERDIENQGNSHGREKCQTVVVGAGDIVDSEGSQTLVIQLLRGTGHLQVPGGSHTLSLTDTMGGWGAGKISVLFLFFFRIANFCIEVVV